MSIPPIQSDDQEFAPIGWTTEAADPVVVLCTRDGVPIVELPIVSASVADALSRASEATFTVSLANRTTLDGLLIPWGGTVIVVIEGRAVWGGTVVKRRTSLGRTSMEVTCREWTAWLDRVWTTAATEYVSPAVSDDCGTVIWDRFMAGYRSSSGYAVRPPFAGMTVTGSTGIPWETDFEDQSDETSPQTLWGEIEQVVASGAEFTMLWNQDGAGHYKPTLQVGKFDASAPALEVVVGSDAVTVTLDIDSDQQATKVKVVGADDIEATVESTDLTQPPLWKVFSYDKIGGNAASDVAAQKQIDTIAASLHSQLRKPILSASDLTLVGLRATYPPGSMVRIVIPSDFDDRFPDGAEATMRVTEVTYAWGEGTRSTQLQLTTLVDALPNSPSQRSVALGGEAEAAPGSAGVVDWLRRLSARVDAVELRRAPAATPAVPPVPVGAVVPFSGATAPTGWLLCDGARLRTFDWLDLFRVIKYTYGGTGPDFLLPDLRGRTVAGLDNMGGGDAGRLDWANTLGTAGGAQTVALTEAQMPSHRHDPTWQDGQPISLNYEAGSPAYRLTAWVGEGARPGITTSTAGSGQAHQNMQPTLLLNYLIRAT